MAIGKEANDEPIDQVLLANDDFTDLAAERSDPCGLLSHLVIEDFQIEWF